MKGLMLGCQLLTVEAHLVSHYGDIVHSLLAV